MSLILSARAISHRYDDMIALRDVSVSVAAGEVVSLLGPSGCGKTTLLRLIAGLERLQTGVIELDGVMVASARGLVPPERRATGMVFQDYALFPHLNVADNVGFGLRGLGQGESRQRVSETLERVDMLAYADSFPHLLSGGQQQRVALARALAPQPRLMLMDGPFSGLDARLRDVVRERTLRILQQAGTAVLMVTHDPEEAMFMSDRIALMRAGRLMQFDEPGKLYFHPVDGFVARFFGDTNLLPVERAGGEARSPFGVMPIPPHLAGIDRLDLMIRPEGFDLQPAPLAQACGLVTGSRFLGACHLLRVRLEDAGCEVSVRVASRVAPPAGSRIGLSLKDGYATVLPACA